MEYYSFNQMINAVNNGGKFTLSVAAAANLKVLETVKRAKDMGLADAILVGDKKVITQMAKDLGINPRQFRIIDEPEEKSAALEAVKLVSRGEADFLMKGMVNTSDFLRAVLHPDLGLRTGRILSHLAVFEIPGYHSLVFVTDGGINISPSVEEKKAILQNAIDFMHQVGYSRPRVAILSANEVVSPKMPATIDADLLTKMAQRGEITGADVFGPLALDLALSEEAATQKRIAHTVAGRANLLLVPNIEVGNILGKALIYFSKATMAGVIVGARVPVVLTSRVSTLQDKMASLALAGLTRLDKAPIPPFFSS